ncbi:MAG: 4Fe-4S binding protein [Desulfobacterales bacterium]|nr:4Fe-4S binding protein [Desulfobacterales bacterium]
MPKIFLQVVEASCIGCERCAEVCPVLAIDFDEKREKAFILDETACICCRQCLDVCPSEAVILEGAYTEKDIYMGR